MKRESKAIEQRIRHTIISALNNLASLGLTDYTNPKFEHYAPRFFDFQDVRAKMVGTSIFSIIKILKDELLFVLNRGHLL